MHRFLKSRTADVRKVLPAYPFAEGCPAAEEVGVAPMVLTTRPTGLASPAQADRED
jgi:hypothetical protein